jgi:regulator of PEP synthase PpsR (kinase-PPPase family)
VSTIYIVSDGTGETAITMIRAALVQYPDNEMNIVRCKNIRTEEQFDAVFDDIVDKSAMVIFTVVSPALREKIRTSMQKKNLISVDLLGPLLDQLDLFLGVTSSHNQAGLLRTVDENYFKRIEAIEFTVKHDDGKVLHDLDLADIVLVGISRTSKTPLSIFLSHKGFKVANVPLVLDQPIAEEVFKIDQRKIIGLTISSDNLTRIRRKRLEKFGQDPGSEYASLAHIQKEIEYAYDIFKKNRRWPVFDVTDRALEETATEIIRVVAGRMDLSIDETF